MRRSSAYHLKKSSKVKALAFFIGSWGMALVACHPARAVPPPDFPRSFDRQTVQNLISNIEQGHNSTVLETGYFLLRAKGSLPIPEGYALLKQALEKEPIASKRWFLMQSVRTTAGFNTEVGAEEGFAAYEAIFDKAGDVGKVGASYILSNAIGSYVADVTGRLTDLRLQNNPRTKAVLFKAWDAYLLNLSQPKAGASQPQWMRAVAATGTVEEFHKEVEKRLQNPKAPLTYGVLKVAAESFSTWDRQKSVKLLLQAKPLLPAKDFVEIHWFYNTLVELQREMGQTAAAIEHQKQLIELTGRGRAKLVSLYAARGDEESLTATITSVKSATADEREVIDLAAALAILPGTATEPNKYAERTVSLLSEYLTAIRKRTPYEEMRARVLLSSTLSRLKRIDEAKAALDIRHLPTPTTVEERHLANQIKTDAQGLADKR